MVPSDQGDIINASISIDTQKASAMSVYIDGSFVGSLEDHNHDEGNITFSFGLGSLSPSKYTLSILSENFGYGNEIGRWGYSTKAKTKDLTGRVAISGNSQTRNWEIDLVDGRVWLSFPGLHDLPFASKLSTVDRRETQLVSKSPIEWSRASFATPAYNASAASLFLDIPTGRGHIWLNGHDLGMYWNITRGDTTDYSQRYYLLPFDYLYVNGTLNELLLFNTLGGGHSSTRLVLSGLKRDETSILDDVVDFPSACI